MSPSAAKCACVRSLLGNATESLDTRCAGAYLFLTCTFVPIWYNAAMNKLLDEAIKKVRTLPDAEQDAAAETILALTEAAKPRRRLTPEQAEEVHRAMAEADRGEFASDEEMTAFFAKCGL